MQISSTHSPLTNAITRVRVHSRRLPPPPVPALESRWALFLDVDGTLLELAATPASVKIPAGLVDLLASLQQRLGGALALISGRRVAMLDKLFEPLRLPCAGLHGFEWRDSTGNEYREAVDENALRTMRAAAMQLAGKLPAVLVEDKTFSIAFHYRKSRLQEEPLRRGIETIARDTGFIVEKGIDVYELRPAHTDKGKALEKLLRDDTFFRRLPIYIGDDLSDEKAMFAAQKFAGIGIQVGPVFSSAARFGLSSPGAVLHWLHRWEEQLS